MNQKNQAESSLKRFLKRKVSYTAALLVSFLITGAIGVASSDASVALESQYRTSQDVLLENIQDQKAYVQGLLDENEARLRELKLNHQSLIRQGDWYSKPYYPSRFGSIMGWYTYSDNVSKNWQGSVRIDTGMDGQRAAFNVLLAGLPAGEPGSILAAAQQTSAGYVDSVYYSRYGSGFLSGSFLSSGWINGTEAYNNNTNVYDYEDKIIILPVVKVPELSEPSAPVVSVSTPAAPAKVDQPNASVPSIAAINVNISQPTIVPPTGPLIPPVAPPTLSAILVNDPGITPTAPTVNVNPTAPVFNITPSAPTLVMTTPDIEPIPPINVIVPNITPVIPSPNANPFSNFGYNWITNTTGAFYGGSGGEPLVQNYATTANGTLWSGVDTSGVVGIVSGATGLVLNGGSPVNVSPSGSRRLATMNFYYDRPAGNIAQVNNVTSYVAGNVVPVNGNGAGGPFQGTSAIHLVGLANVTGSEFNLYGRAAVVNMESWRSPILTITSSVINVREDNNTLFNIQAGNYATEASFNDGSRYAGAIRGSVDINVGTTGNSIYAIAGYTRGFTIENSGAITLDGASNIVVSGLGFVANSSKYIGTGGAPTMSEGSINNYIPSILINSNPIEQYGDENITLFFNTTRNIPNEGNIGIYQGEIGIKAIIGEYLDSASSTITQTANGILTSHTSYTPTTVDANVGVYAISGQRTGLIPSTHLGASSFNNLDAIHNLEVGNFEIIFGPFSKNGFMFLAKNGTVIDVGASSSVVDIGSVSTFFTDGIDGVSTTEARASTGTIIAYSEGLWRGATHQITGASALEDEQSEVIVHIPLTMSSKDGIAFFADAGGKVTVKANASAYNYGAIMAYADGSATKSDSTQALSAVNIDPGVTITANDNLGTTVTERYQNIGALAKNGGRIEFNGIAEIRGIGALADGTGSLVRMNNLGNIINSGVSGSLVADNGGMVEFAGTINHGNGTIDDPDDYDESTPFYANNGGEIIFTGGAGSTQIHMHKGILFTGLSADYDSGISVGTKYQGMGSVEITLEDHGVKLGIFDGVSLTYLNETGYLNSIGSYVGLASGAIEPNGYTYDSYLRNGTLNVTAPTINLNSDPFANITMENELVTFNGTAVTSTSGGLAMGSRPGVPSNTSNGYINNGTINISGGSDPVAVYVNFGTISNNGTITITDGIGVAGVNGSIITNSLGSKIIVDPLSTTGVGIVGLSTSINSAGLPDPVTPLYGSDETPTIPSINIINVGDVEAIGIADAIGIYAENNTDVDKNLATVVNSGKIIVGDRGTGIMATNTKGSSTDKGVMLSLSGTGTSDIEIGEDSVGIYAKNSEVDFTSDYGIEVKDGSVGIYTIGNFVNAPSPTTADSYLNMSSSDRLTLTYTGGVSGNAAALYYDNDLNQALTTPMNIHLDVTTPGHTGVVAGIVAKDHDHTTLGGTLTNSGNITSATGGVYGIVSSDVDVTNTGSIQVGISGGTGGTGIFATRAAVTTDGSLIAVDGDKAIGVYAVNEASTTPPLPPLATDKIIAITGTGTMNVNDRESIGVYVKDNSSGLLTLNNSTNLVLNNGITNAADRVIGLALENSQGGINNNINTGNITVNNHNIGIYLEDSNIINTSTINVTNSISGIGIFAETNPTGTSLVELDGSIINVSTAGTLTSDIPIGVFADGNDITIDGGTGVAYTVGPNGIGNLLDGDSTTINNFNFSLSSSLTNISIGSYYSGGAYGDIGTVTLVNTSATGDRPIGLFYGSNSTQNRSDVVITASSDEVIGIYGDGLTFTNHGNITLNTQSIGAYFTNTNLINNGIVTMAGGTSNRFGLYIAGGISTNNAQINVDGTNSIGIIATNDGTNGATVTNTATINIAAGSTTSIGAYSELGSTFINSGTINGNSLTSIGEFAIGTGTVTNTGTISTNNLGMYGEGDGTNGATVNNSGIINITANGKMGVLVEADGSTANLTGGSISSITNTDILGVVADDAVVNLSGTNISLLGQDSVGISLENNSTGNLTSGNVTVGANGTAVYSESSAVDISGYTGTLTMGNEGIGLYVDNSTLTTTPNQNLNITYNNADKGVGIYYTNIGGTLTNDITVDHTAGGQELVHIFIDNINLTNTASQEVLDGGIGIYADNVSTVDNQGVMTLTGDDSVGIYLDGNSILTNIGTITAANPPSSGTSKVGVYVRSGDVIGSSTYNFGIAGGIGMYLANNTVNYTGTINVTGASPNSNDRTIGMYVADTVPASNLATDINVTGADAIGLYLASNGGSAADITYNGNLSITGTSTGNRGLGAYLDVNSTFTLGASGTVTIGGTDNIGFYVSSGANLNVTGGTVTNTVDGIFAYLDNGNLHFTGGSPLNVNFTNVIVNGPAATLLNDTTITVGNGGLQGAGGATITNSLTGEINGTTANAKGMIGTGSGTTLHNNGDIVFTGLRSVGMYTENGAHGISNGDITVGDQSVAYYAGLNGSSKGTLEINGTATIGENSSIMYANGGDIAYKAGNITVGDKMSALTIEDGGSVVDFFGSDIIVNAGGVGVYATGTGSVDTGVTNLNKLLVNADGVGIYLDNTLIAFNDNQAIELAGDRAIGVLGGQPGVLNYTGNIIGTAEETKGIVSMGAGAVAQNSGVVTITGESGIGLYGENGSLVENTAAGIINIAKGTSAASAVGVYGKNTTTTSNAGNILIVDESVGIYGENTSIVNTGNISNTVGYATGIYGESATATNNGIITMGDMANGIFVQNGTIINNSTITVGEGIKTEIPGSNPKEYTIEASVGIYAGVGTTVYHNPGAMIVTGDYGVGIAGGLGSDINILNGANFNLGEESMYVYTNGGTGINEATISLSDYSV